ncbi:MAG: magnesium transporter, partial [Chloroflexi bacterium]|nr:magnesium transporter [Chloroflexota bacterium]
MTVPSSIDLERLQQRIAEDDLATAAAELRQLLPADEADLLRELLPPDQVRVLAAMPAAQVGGLLDYLVLEGPEVAEAVSQLSTQILTTVLDQTPPGTAARLLRLFPDERRQEVLATLREQEAIEALIAQEEETAGALVTTEFVALRAGMIAEEAIRAIRRTRPLSGKLSSLFVVDHSDRLVGSVSFRDLLLAAPRTPLTLVMDGSALSVPAGTPQEECARLMQHYHLSTLPVVD